MLGFEDIKWQLDVAQTALELEARQRTILNILIEAGIMTAPQFNEKLAQMKEQEYFKDNFEQIQKAREELEKPFDFMDLLTSLGGKNERS